MLDLQGTTIVAVKKKDAVAIAGDGQVTFGNTMIMKHSAQKVRRLYQGKVLAGFAGSVADAITLCSKFETKLEEYNGNILRAAVELAKEWRTDRVLRRLEAMLLVADLQHLFILSGNGEVIEPDDGVTAIGSGGGYALAAARAMLKYAPDLSAAQIATEAIRIASSICIYTNEHIHVEELPVPKKAGEESI